MPPRDDARRPIAKNKKALHEYHVLAELASDRERLNRERPGGVSGPVRGFVIPTLRTIGLFSERIEGYFRQMFAANFGEERARQLDLNVPFPVDIDAWLEQRA